MGPVQHNVNSVDVLHAHHICNHASRPPNPEALCRHVTTKHKSLQMASENQSSEDMNDDDDQNSEEQCGPHVLKKAKPEALMYYPVGWRSMLIMAKRLWQHHVATRNPFPDQDYHLGQVETIIKQAIHNYLQEEGILEDGLTFCSYFFCIHI